MRILIIADVHANLPALDAVLARERADHILFAGDAVGYGPHPNEVVEVLRSLKAVSVMGNHDYAVLTGRTEWFNPLAAWAIEWTQRTLKKENREWLAGLRTTERIVAEGKILQIVHGSPRDPLFEYVFPDTDPRTLRSFLKQTGADILVLGHTHVPFIFEWRGRYVVNPGSVGQPRDGDPRASYVVIDTETWRIRLRRVKYDVERTVKDMQREGFPEPLWRRLYEGV